MMTSPKSSWLNVAVDMPPCSVSQLTRGMLSARSSITSGPPAMNRAPEDGAEDRADAADDDDGDELDGQRKAPLVGGDELRVAAEQGAGHRREGAREGEGADLVARQVDADDLGGDVAVADGLHGPARPGAHDVLGEERAEGDEDPDQPEERLVVGERLADDVERRRSRGGRS